MHRTHLITALACGVAAVMMALLDNRIAVVLFILAYVNFMATYCHQMSCRPTRKGSSDD